MNLFVLLHSAVVNLFQLGMYLLFWFIYPATAIALILFTVGRGLFLVARKLRHSNGDESAT